MRCTVRVVFMTMRRDHRTAEGSSCIIYLSVDRRTHVTHCIYTYCYYNICSSIIHNIRNRPCVQYLYTHNIRGVRRRWYIDKGRSKHYIIGYTRDGTAVNIFWRG